MSKKITQKEFLNRFKTRYPTSDIQLIEYTAISKPLKIKCNKCGRILTRKIARQILNGFDCCGARDETMMDRIRRLYAENKDYEIVKQVDRGHIITKHLVCGNEQKRDTAAVLDNPFSCKHCETKSTKLKTEIKEVQKELDDRFQENIKILEYNGCLLKNKYKCLKCGFIFEQKHVCILQSRGCPKCDGQKSLGEKIVARFLEEKNIKFEEQASVPKLPLQHFDFALFDDNDELIGYLEVQGEQHRRPVEIFKTPLEKTQERDQRKRNYCKKYNIPLYELIYEKGKIKNFDILPF